MRVRTMVGIAAGTFAFSLGSVTAFRLPEDSLSAMAAMMVNAIIFIVMMIVVIGISGIIYQGRRQRN